MSDTGQKINPLCKLVISPSCVPKFAHTHTYTHIYTHIHTHNMFSNVIFVFKKANHLSNSVVLKTHTIFGFLNKNPSCAFCA